MPKEKWIIIESEDVCIPLFTGATMNSLTSDLERMGFKNLKRDITEFTGFQANLIFIQKDWQEVARYILKKTIKEPGIMFKIYKEGRKYTKKLFTVSKEIIKTDFSRLTNKQILKFFKQFLKYKEITHMNRTPMWLMETRYEYFSGYMRQYLKKQIEKRKLNLNPDVVYSILASPTEKNFAVKEKEEILKIGIAIKKNKKLVALFRKKSSLKIDEKLKEIDSVLDKKIDQHYKKFCWLSYGFLGPAWDKFYFIKTLSNILKRKADLTKELNKLQSEPQKLKTRQKQILKKLKPDSLHKKLIQIANESIAYKAYSKDIMFFSFYAVEKLLRETSRRFNLSLKQTRWIFPWEFEDLLLGKRKISIDQLNKRARYCLQYSVNGRSKLFTGKKAYDFMKEINLEREKITYRKVNQLKGTCAYPGKAIGLAKIINTPKELHKMKNGDILISKMTNPDIITAMKMASAIVTDLGGITCHAAIVSRELKIPCLIGTKIATRVFRDGHHVEVDTEQGIIRKIV